MRTTVLAMLDSYGPELHTLLVRLTLRVDVADDLLQDLFVKLAASTALRNTANSHAYIRRMAINLAFDWRRARARSQRLAASCNISETAVSTPEWLKLSQREETERILTLASQLPTLQREAFALRFVHDETYERIGEAMERTPHQARALCHAAIREIRKELGPAEHSGRVSLTSK